MYSGLDCYKDFLNRIDKSYSKFVDKVKLGRIFDRALSALGEQRWMGLVTQKQYDDLKFQVSTENIFQISNGNISISPLMVKNITRSGNVVILETLGKHNLSPLDLVTISDVQGFTTVPFINSTHTITGVPSSTKIEFSVTATSGTHTPNTGSLIHDKLISDYIHLFALKAKFQEILPIKINKSINGNPCYVEFNKRVNLRDGDKLIISGYDDQLINGTRFVQYLTDFRFRLYLDKELTLPLTGVRGINILGGTVKKEIYNYASNWSSDDKISTFKTGTHENPVYETSDGAIKITPKDCQEVTVDYFSKPKIKIDLNDNTADLLLVYPFSFIDRLINEAVLLYAPIARDQLLEAQTGREIQRNA